jgi:hypothetical protein
MSVLPMSHRCARRCSGFVVEGTGSIELQQITITNIAVQPDPFAAGQNILVVGGSMGDDKIRIRPADDKDDDDDRRDADWDTLKVMINEETWARQDPRQYQHARGSDRGLRLGGR